MRRLVPSVVFLAGLCPALSIWPVDAAVPVEERGDQRGNRTTSTVTVQQAQPVQQAADPRPASNTALVELFNELQVLRGEVQELRGLVEQQGYQLRQLEQTQSEQYRDVDRRLSTLVTSPTPRGQVSTPAVAGTTTSTANVGDGAQQGAAPTTTRAVKPPTDEREAYNSGFEAMKGRRYDESIGTFTALIQTFPNGQFTPNAFYWLGEIYLAKNDTENARQSFAQLINLFPAHQKVPDALYKMGVVYHRLDDRQRALEYFDRVKSDHPDSSAAGLARTYAAELN